MALAISAVANNDMDSPGVDLTISGLTGFDSVTVERIDNESFYPTVPVRGLDDVPASATMAVTDFEAPIGHSVKYRVSGYDANPGIEIFGVGAAAAGTTSCAPTYPSGSTAGDLHLLVTVSKAYTGSVATPSGWTLVANYVSGSTASGADTGSVDVYVFQREGAFSGSVTVTGTGTNTIIAQIVGFRKITGASWTVSSVSGIDDSPGTTYTATSSAFQPQRKDFILFATGFNTDEITTLDTTSATITSINGDISFSNKQEVFKAQAAQGDDVSIVAHAAEVTAVDASDTVRWTITHTSNLAGLTAFVRITTSATATEQAESNSVELSFDMGAAWIKSVNQAALSRYVTIQSLDAVQMEPRILGEYDVLGRSKPVILTDAWGGRKVKVTILTDDTPVLPGTYMEIKTLLTQGDTLLLQTQDGAQTGFEDMYFEVTSYSTKRLGRFDGTTNMTFVHEIGMAEVDRPTTTAESLGLRSWQDVKDENATWQAVLNNYSSWLEVLQQAP